MQLAQMATLVVPDAAAKKNEWVGGRTSHDKWIYDSNPASANEVAMCMCNYK